jgi:hypothetical protein
MFFLLASLTFASCGGSAETEEKSAEEEIAAPKTLPPKEGDSGIVPVDYSDQNNWAYIDQKIDKKVDVFYVYPTVFQRESGQEYLAAIDNGQVRLAVPTVIAQQAMAYEKAGNVFAPYYRQLDAMWTLNLSAEEQEDYLMGAPYSDVVAAFEYYLKNYNNGRPFILAGHSQGSNVLKFLLEHYMKDNPDVYEKMVAAYIIGFSVTQDDLDTYKHLKFAKGETDTGVVISWNTEAPNMDVKNPVVQEGALAINPISWTTDEETAYASLNPGSRFFNDDGSLVDRYGQCDATVDKERGVIVCSTVNPEKFVTEGSALFPTGVYHGQDYPFYWHAIEENAVKRVNAFLAE